MIVEFLKAVFAFIVVLGPLVFVHELGHFLAAKAFRIGVPVFSLGFGPRLFGFRRKETDYRVSLIPLGGYVRMTGDEADENRTGASDEFLSKPKWQRFIVFFAGPAFNVILAFLTLWVLFAVYGKDSPEIYPTVYAVAEESPAERAGIQRGDRILALGGRDVQSAEVFLDTYLLKVALAPNSVVDLAYERDGERRTVRLETGENAQDGSGDPGWSYTWQGSEPAVIDRVVEDEAAQRAGLESGDRIVAAGERDPISEIELRLLILASGDREVPLRIERGGDLFDVTVVPRQIEGRGGLLGVDFRPSHTFHRDLTIGEAAAESFHRNVALSRWLFVTLSRLMRGMLSLKTVSSPIGIAEYAEQALSTGPDALLYMLGFFSLQLGVLNLLPIPVLDGGHILLLLVEGVMRRELSQAIKERVMQVGLIFLIGFMAVILYLDVAKRWF